MVAEALGSLPSTHMGRIPGSQIWASPALMVEGPAGVNQWMGTLYLAISLFLHLPASPSNKQIIKKKEKKVKWAI